MDAIEQRGDTQMSSDAENKEKTSDTLEGATDEEENVNKEATDIKDDTVTAEDQLESTTETQQLNEGNEQSLQSPDVNAAETEKNEVENTGVLSSETGGEVDPEAEKQNIVTDDTNVLDNEKVVAENTDETNTQEIPTEDADEANADDAQAIPTDNEEQLPEGEEKQPEAANPNELPSDTFENGDAPEAPVIVGERLSREGSLTGQDLSGQDHEFALEFGTPPVPGTPRLDEEEEEEEEEYYEDEADVVDRERLIEQYQQAVQEQNDLREKNQQLQTKLSDYFRKKRAEDGRLEDNKASAENQQQRYIKFMATLDDLRRRDSVERELYKKQIEELKDKCENRQRLVEQEMYRFNEFKKQIALGSVNTRSGRALQLKDVEMYLANDAKKEAEVIQVCIENIKLKNKLKKKELQLKSKEELAEGLHMIDFEQLKIENQTYNEKIEERNEDLLKLRKKITTTVQTLTHVKEKLQFIQAENEILKEQLMEVDTLAAKKRDALSRTKQARDSLRNDNQRLKQSSGLLGNNALLRDFEEREDESTDLTVKCQRLKQEHAELSLMLNRVRKKLEQAQTVSR